MSAGQEPVGRGCTAGLTIPSTIHEQAWMSTSLSTLLNNPLNHLLHLSKKQKVLGGCWDELNLNDPKMIASKAPEGKFTACKACKDPTDINKDKKAGLTIYV
jgi:hypothetical protein